MKGKKKEEVGKETNEGKCFSRGIPTIPKVKSNPSRVLLYDPYFYKWIPIDNFIRLAMRFVYSK